MDPDVLVSAFNKFVEELTREKWVEVLEIQVNAQGEEFAITYEHQLDYDRIDGIAVNYVEVAKDNGAGEIVDFKLDNQSLFFDKGMTLDLITARDHQNLSDRFFIVSKELKRNENLQITIKDTTTGAFTAYTRKFYILMSKAI